MPTHPDDSLSSAALAEAIALSLSEEARIGYLLYILDIARGINKAISSSLKAIQEH